MPRVTIHLLGPPLVRHDGSDVFLPSQKALGLLFLLAAQPGQVQPRSRLVAQLWEESGEREGRNSLSVALSRLRQSLPALPLSAEGDALTLPATPALWVDTAAFLDQAHDRADLATLEAAAALWRGPFLDGFAVRDSASYEEWLRLEREQWQARALALLDRLSAAHEARGDWQRAIHAARRALAIDALQEHLHRTIMRLQARAGDRAAAIAQYRACQELLRDELGAEPDPETTALYEAIAHGRFSRHGLVATPAPDRPRLPPIRLAPPALPLIGRERELAGLRALLAQCADGGHGRLIVVQGEAGIGKSRLVEEVLRTLDATGSAGWGVLIGHSYEAERSLPYRPFVDALTAVLRSLDPATLGLPDVWLAEVARLLPDLLAQRPQLTAPAPLDPVQERYRLFEGIARLLAALGAPLLLVLEDLHWADEGTLQLLSFLLRHEASRRLLVIATVRTEDLREDLAGLLRSVEREGRLTAIRLERLRPHDTIALLRNMVSNPVLSLGERLHAETEGNPLFAVELVRSLIEQGTLRVGSTDPLHSVVLPDTIQAVITSRLARLDEPARSLLNAAAIFRRGAGFEAIQAVSGLAEDEALDALERLLRAQLLREMVDRARPSGGDETYVFGHDKIRQAVYEGLSAARRRVLHRRAVEVLAAGAAPAEELAYHACQGQLWQSALPWSETAAAEAKRVFGYAAATHLYHQALECLAHLPASAEGQRHEVELRLQLAQVGFYLQPGALTDWLAPAETAAAALGDDELLTRVRLAQAGAIYIQGRFTLALPLLERLAGAPVIAASADLQARYYNTLGRLLVLRGELRRAVENLERALPLMEGRSAPMDLLVSTNMLASAYAYLGDFDRALALAEAMRQQAEALGDPSIRGVSLAFLEVIAVTRGQWATAAEFGRQAITLSHAGANSIYEYVGHVFLGPALARQGDLDGALAVMRQALLLAEQAEIKVLLSRAHGWLAEILLLAGQVEESLATARRGQAIAREHGWTLEGAICARSLAQVHAARGDWTEAEAALDESLRVLEHLEALPDLARSEAVLSQLAAARGDLARAETAARRAGERFARMGMANDLATLPRLAAGAD
jgi:DNA-binding SARP family transcriptional activator/ATP/maltotriose-dependent transcriptional regulator MalT